jgi:hypothetical protein
MKKLERSQMKNLMGGVEDNGGPCQALLNPSPGVWTIVTGLTYTEASTSNSRQGEHWCCASCATATWAL